MVKYEFVEEESDDEIKERMEKRYPAKSTLPDEIPKLKVIQIRKKVTNIQDKRTTKIMGLEDAFNWLVENSSFQRSIVEFIKKVVPGFDGNYERFSKEKMNEAFQERVDGVKDAIKGNYSDVMKEFKEKLKKLQVK